MVTINDVSGEILIRENRTDHYCLQVAQIIHDFVYEEEDLAARRRRIKLIASISDNLISTFNEEDVVNSKALSAVRKSPLKLVKVVAHTRSPRNSGLSHIPDLSGPKPSSESDFETPSPPSGSKYKKPSSRPKLKENKKPGTPDQKSKKHKRTKVCTSGSLLTIDAIRF